MWIQCKWSADGLDQLHHWPFSNGWSKANNAFLLYAVYASLQCHIRLEHNWRTFCNVNSSATEVVLQIKRLFAYSLISYLLLIAIFHCRGVLFMLKTDVFAFALRPISLVIKLFFFIPKKGVIKVE